MILYLITNRQNGMRYVGITSRRLPLRWTEHVSDALAGKGWALHVAIRKFGPDAFQVEAIETADDWGALCQRERDMVAELGCMSPLGYNLTVGGEGAVGRPVSAETRAKLSAAHKGKKLTADHRAKLAAAKKGKKLPPRSADHSAKIAEGLRRSWARRKDL